MNWNLSGSEFTALVAEKIGRRMEHPEVIATFYDSALRGGRTADFSDLAFYAKSYQKAARLLSNEIADDKIKNTVTEELKSLISRFTDVAEGIMGRMPAEEGDQLRSRYFVLTQDSFRNLQTLMSDFAEVKDFLLLERDGGKGKQ